MNNDDEFEVKAYVDFGQDSRYPWVHVELLENQSPMFSIRIGNNYYGFSLDGDEMRPICLCSAYTASECICETGNWGDEDYDDCDY